MEMEINYLSKSFLKSLATLKEIIVAGINFRESKMFTFGKILFL